MRHSREARDDYAEGYSACAEDSRGLGGFGIGGLLCYYLWYGEPRMKDFHREFDGWERRRGKQAKGR